MSEFVKFKVSDDLKNLQTEVMAKVVKSGKVKIGINEVTKTVERKTAKLVIIAEDVSPAEIVMHIPLICKEKGVPFSYASTREELGKLAGISAKASSIAITDEGVAKKEFSSLLSKIAEITGDKKPAAKAEKPAPKKETKKEEVAKEVKKEEAEEKAEEKKE